MDTSLLLLLGTVVHSPQPMWATSFTYFTLSLKIMQLTRIKSCYVKQWCWLCNFFFLIFSLIALMPSQLYIKSITSNHSGSCVTCHLHKSDVLMGKACTIFALLPLRLNHQNMRCLLQMDKTIIFFKLFIGQNNLALRQKVLGNLGFIWKKKMHGKTKS